MDIKCSAGALSSRRAFLTSGVVAGVLASGALFGCSSSSTAPEPNGTQEFRSSAVSAADKSWAADLSSTDLLLYVTTFGSSTCPSFITSIKLLEADHLEVTTDTEGHRMCSADLAPYTSAMAVPESVFANETLQVTLKGNPENISLIIHK